MKKLQLLILMLLVSISLCVAQDSTKLTEDMFGEVQTENEINSTTKAQPDKSAIRELTPLSSYEFYLSLIVLGFGIFALLLEVWLIHKKAIDQDNLIKFIVVTIIITATLFLITAGYDNDQIAPAMGLLGTIAGYLLGKQEKNNDKKAEEKKEEKPAKENKEKPKTEEKPKKDKKQEIKKEEPKDELE